MFTYESSFLAFGLAKGFVISSSSSSKSLEKCQCAYSIRYNKIYLRILTFKTLRRVIKKFDLAIAPMTPPFETFGTVSLSGDSGPQIASHLQHLNRFFVTRNRESNDD